MKIRLAKAISNKGYCSRREAEKLIAAGRIKVNNMPITELVTLVSEDDDIEVIGQNAPQENVRLWIYHKPVGIITTHNDPQNRRTVFDDFPIKTGGHIVSVGRLDLNSEGLLLMTNSKSLAHTLERPTGDFLRIYKVRVFGKIPNALAQISKGITIDGVYYKPVKIALLQEGKNSWFKIGLSEGKNREIRKIFDHFGLSVNRLIRTDYGPFSLGDLEPSKAIEVPNSQIKSFTESKC
jgi:23S rRNA pseudouridine2605 synthase